MSTSETEQNGTSETVTLRVWFETKQVGSAQREVIETEITVTEWAAMTEAERDTAAEQYYRDWMFEQFESGWTVIDGGES